MRISPTGVCQRSRAKPGNAFGLVESRSNRRAWHRHCRICARAEMDHVGVGWGCRNLQPQRGSRSNGRRSGDITFRRGGICQGRRSGENQRGIVRDRGAVRGAGPEQQFRARRQRLRAGRGDRALLLRRCDGARLANLRFAVRPAAGQSDHRDRESLHFGELQCQSVHQGSPRLERDLCGARRQHLDDVAELRRLVDQASRDLREQLERPAQFGIQRSEWLERGIHAPVLRQRGRNRHVHFAARARDRLL